VQRSRPFGKRHTTLDRHSPSISLEQPSTPASSPPGGPAPAHLLGVWMRPHPAPNRIDDFTQAVHANAYAFNITRTALSSGDIVVNGNESTSSMVRTAGLVCRMA
jgi:hypothetical protein